MKSIGDKRVIVKLQEAKVTRLEVSVEAINKITSTIVTTLQEEKVMSLKEVIQQRKKVRITILIYNVYCVV